MAKSNDSMTTEIQSRSCFSPESVVKMSKSVFRNLFGLFNMADKERVSFICLQHCGLRERKSKFYTLFIRHVEDYSLIICHVEDTKQVSELKFTLSLSPMLKTLNVFLRTVYSLLSLSAMLRTPYRFLCIVYSLLIRHVEDTKLISELKFTLSLYPQC